MVKIAAVYAPSVRKMVPGLGTRNATSDKGIRLLGWTPRPPQEALVAGGESPLRPGVW